jgi:hypothetical protein
MESTDTSAMNTNEFIVEFVHTKYDAYQLNDLILAPSVEGILRARRKIIADC